MQQMARPLIVLAIFCALAGSVSCHVSPQQDHLRLLDEQDLGPAFYQRHKSAIDRSRGAAMRELLGLEHELQALAHSFEPLEIVRGEQAPDNETLPLASSLWGTIAVVVAYFSVYALLVLLHSWRVAQRYSLGPIESLLESVMVSVSIAPMMCVLFFAVYKRADCLAQGQPRPDNLPPAFVSQGIVTASAAFCAQGVFQVVSEWPQGQEALPEGWKALARIFLWKVLHQGSLLLMFASLATVILGLVTMGEPKELRNTSSALNLATGTFCSAILGAVHLGVYAVLHIAQSLDCWSKTCQRGYPLQDRNQLTSTRALVEILKMALTTMSFTPMLAILFLGAQIAADWGNQALPGYVEMSMYICCFVIFVQVAMLLVVPVCTQSDFQGSTEPLILTSNHRWFAALGVIRWTAIAAMYGAAAVVCTYLWSVTVEPFWIRLLTRLSSCFFCVYLMLWVTLTLKQAGVAGLNSLMRTLTSAKDTVAFAPMLGVLFLTAWVRAARTRNLEGLRGIPQGYAQDAMWMATASLIAQVVLAVVTGICWRVPKDPDTVYVHGDCIKTSLRLLSLCFYIAMALSFSSVATLIVSILTISPSTATGEGSLLT